MMKRAIAVLLAVGTMSGVGTAVADEYDINVTGELVLGCSVTPPAGGIDFAVQDADGTLSAPKVDFDLTVNCRDPFKLTWPGGTDQGYQDLTNHGQPADTGFLRITERDGSSMDATTGPEFTDTEQDVTVSLSATVSSDTDGTQNLARATSLNSVVQIDVNY